MPMAAPNVDETYHQKTGKTNQSQINFDANGGGYGGDQYGQSRKGQGFNSEFNAFESNLKF